MGLLDGSLDNVLELLRTAAQNQNLNDGSADAANGAARSWGSRPQQAPLSFAGPALAANINAASSDRARTAVPLPRPRPAEAPPAPDVSWPGTAFAPMTMAPRDRRSAGLPDWARPPTGNPFAEQPRDVPGAGWPTAQDLTAHALRLKGAPESTIAATIDKPELLQQLRGQFYGPSSVGAPAADDALWSGRAPAAPVVLPPQDAPTAPPEPEGHGKSDRLPAGVPIWARPPRGNPFEAYRGAIRGVPGMTDQNLTVSALRMRGVPEPDIAAAVGNPNKMKQLINQNFGPGSAGTRSALPSAAAAPIGDDRAMGIAALRGIPFAGAYVDRGTAVLNAAAQPFLETGLSHAGTFAARTTENERTIKGATDQYESDHPIKTSAGRTLAVSTALGPVGLTTLGARALGTAGEALLPSVVKAATTLGLLFAGDAAWRGGDAKDIVEHALYGIGGGTGRAVANKALTKAVETVAPLLTPIFNKPP